ncbi:uncharacterized protein LOC132725302 [Ruditapes philippinarum]|uniref:uncharacterized protein LOC132725302 n=1 Tax=Ruditapes philippinarum TaxID=129788 RepID=UPI00295B761C|nr:uncharacterized protein LOC132725302 [Ruditapes philippinarum]
MEFLKVLLFMLVVLICYLEQTDATMCYKCDHVAHPRDCDRVVQCKEGETCHVISYAQPDGHFYYVTGCMAKASCPAGATGFGKRDIAFCNRCCHADYCNKELCDGPPPTTHGPRCLQCSTVEHPTHCGAVTECANGQVCFTREKYVFGELRYQLGCADQGCTPQTYRSLVERQASQCHKCCTGENCNRDLCLNTGSPLTKAPATVATKIPVTEPQTQPPVTAPQTHAHTHAPTNTPSNSQTTFIYNLRGCHYKGKVYHKGDTWDEGCDFRCTCIDDRSGRYTCQDICPTYINVPKECSMVRAPGECCSHPDCHGIHIHYTNSTSTNSTGFTGINECYYKGNTYKQDEKWRDSCEYECTCVEANRGYYRCSSLCYTWNLPDKCHLDPPAAGKCCKTPSCPGGYVINYPQGYVAN